MTVGEKTCQCATLLSPEKQQNQGIISVTLDVASTWNRKGDEIVQLYVRDMVSSVTTYETRLRGFERISLDPGETKVVGFKLGPEDLELLDKDMHWGVEPGQIQVLTGSRSEDIRLKGTFEIMQNMYSLIFQYMFIIELILL